MLFVITPATGLCFGLLSALVINRISSILHRTDFVYPRNIKEINSEYNYWRYRNFLISFIHAFLTGTGSLVCVMNSPFLLIDVIDTYTDFGYMLTAFSLGYFVYDMVEMLTHINQKGSIELVLHHILVISCFLNTILFKKFIGYNMIALLVEISNIFLHFRQLLLLSNHSKSSRIYRTNSIINLAFFVMVRGVCMFWLWYTLILNMDQLPLITKMVAFVSMIGISITTMVLFIRIIKSDFIRCRISVKKNAFNGLANQEKFESIKNYTQINKLE